MCQNQVFEYNFYTNCYFGNRFSIWREANIWPASTSSPASKYSWRARHQLQDRGSHICRLPSLLAGFFFQSDLMCQRKFENEDILSFLTDGGLDLFSVLKALSGDCLQFLLLQFGNQLGNLWCRKSAGQPCDNKTLAGQSTGRKRFKFGRRKCRLSDISWSTPTQNQQHKLNHMQSFLSLRVTSLSVYIRKERSS